MPTDPDGDTFADDELHEDESLAWSTVEGAAPATRETVCVRCGWRYDITEDSACPDCGEAEEGL